MHKASSANSLLLLLLQSGAAGADGLLSQHAAGAGFSRMRTSRSTTNLICTEAELYGTAWDEAPRLKPIGPAGSGQAPGQRQLLTHPEDHGLHLEAVPRTAPMHLLEQHSGDADALGIVGLTAEQQEVNSPGAQEGTPGSCSIAAAASAAAGSGPTGAESTAMLQPGALPIHAGPISAAAASTLTAVAALRGPPPAPSSLSDLPDDVLRSILSCLDPNSRHLAASTSEHLLTIAQPTFHAMGAHITADSAAMMLAPAPAEAATAAGAAAPTRGTPSSGSAGSCTPCHSASSSCSSLASMGASSSGSAAAAAGSAAAAGAAAAASGLAQPHLPAHRFDTIARLDLALPEVSCRQELEALEGPGHPLHAWLSAYLGTGRAALALQSLRVRAIAASPSQSPTQQHTSGDGSSGGYGGLGRQRSHGGGSSAAGGRAGSSCYGVYGSYGCSTYGSGFAGSDDRWGAAAGASTSYGSYGSGGYGAAGWADAEAWRDARSSLAAAQPLPLGPREHGSFVSAPALRLLAERCPNLSRLTLPYLAPAAAPELASLAGRLRALTMGVQVGAFCLGLAVDQRGDFARWGLCGWRCAYMADMVTPGRTLTHAHAPSRPRRTAPW